MQVELPRGMPFPRITAVEVGPPYGLRLAFQDGTSGMIDGRRWLRDERPGVFEPLRDPAEFAKVYLRPDLGTIAWSDDIDLCPDVLYALAHGIPLPGLD